MEQPFEGIITNLERRYKETTSEWARAEIEESMRETPCPACGGRRLKKELLAVTVGGLNIMEFCEKPVSKGLEFFEQLHLTEQQNRIAQRIVKEACARLGFLNNVGLGYLTLARA